MIKKDSDPVAKLEKAIGMSEEISTQQEFYEYLHDEIKNYERKMSVCYKDLDGGYPPGTKKIIADLSIEYSKSADVLRDVRTKFLEMFHAGVRGWRDKKDCLNCIIENKKIED